eukprot:CAMPEP_0168570442 /NCGR_PEP_ID=MMETSP0413-20121227/16723_1 /TAXON_ID=136452 /ORGANISM="Filamoeba nolandi, Strain NC-AS-23-1" /LENGTH=293 /DNA_ID=CAMNT_0008603065 /DNA_START=26 /DNA_END=907 /DNA_ORIENTATION=-
MIERFHFEEPVLDLTLEQFATDAFFVTLSAILFTLARIHIQKVFMKIAEALNIREAVKFTESGWKSLWYTVSFAWGCSIAFGNGWFPNVHLAWEDLKGHEIATSHRVFQVVELGFYFHSLFAHFFLEVHRSDFWAMLFHHIVTIFLILTSYVSGFYRIGILVLVVHDINDVIFEAGKLLHYQEKKSIEPFVTGLFGLFVVVWVVARLGVFPFVVIRSVFVHAPHSIQYHTPTGYWMKRMTIGLLFLELLHIYWFVLIVGVMHRTLTGKVLDDPRETKEKLAQQAQQAQQKKVQ